MTTRRKDRKPKEKWMCVMNCIPIGIELHKGDEFRKCDYCGRTGYCLRPVVRKGKGAKK